MMVHGGCGYVIVNGGVWLCDGIREHGYMFLHGGCG